MTMRGGLERDDYDARLTRLEEMMTALEKQWRPMLEALHSDMLYRQRKHAESVGQWSTRNKILAALLGLYAVGLQTVTLVLTVHQLGGGGHP